MQRSDGGGERQRLHATPSIASHGTVCTINPWAPPDRLTELSPFVMTIDHGPPTAREIYDDSRKIRVVGICRQDDNLSRPTTPSGDARRRRTKSVTAREQNRSSRARTPKAGVARPSQRHPRPTQKGVKFGLSAQFSKNFEPSVSPSLPLRNPLSSKSQSQTSRAPWFLIVQN